MSLPFVPAEHALEAFDQLHQHALQFDHEKIEEFMQYVRSTWFQSSVWTPDNWSVFQQTVRTNNIVEGWHHRLNTRIRYASCSVYILIPALYVEAQTVEVQIQQVTEMALSMYQRKKYVKVHQRLFKLWDMYMDGELTTSELLKSAAKISGFAPTAPLATADPEA